MIKHDCTIEEACFGDKRFLPPSRGYGICSLMKEIDAIATHELTRLYGANAAVDHLSFRLEAGKVLGLLGPNGAGKSTTIKMLITLLPPTSGTAKVMGYDIVKEPFAIRKNIGYVPQLLSADGALTGYENLLLSAKLHGMSRKNRQRRIDGLLSFMGLTDSAHKLVNEYSGGMIRRLEIAQALLHGPSVLFLDEPTVGLDPAARKTLWLRIQELRKEYNTTILLTTHDMEEADVLCDLVAFMHLGRIIAMDTPAKLKAMLGPNATLGDVFIHFTGATIKDEEAYSNVKQTRRTISRL